VRLAGGRVQWSGLSICVRTRRHAITVEEYFRMCEADVFAPDARLELIEGELVEMAPISSADASVVNALAALLREAALRGRVAPPSGWVENS
jgi:Uma2 family endonuclease